MVSGSKNRYSFTTLASRKKVEKILAATSEKPQSRSEIEKLICIAEAGVKRYIKHLLENKQIYISKWKLEKQGERVMFYPYYSAGNRKNKPKPPNLTQSQKCKRYREKLKKDDELKDKLNAKRRARRIIPKPDWTTSWIKSSLSGQSKTE